MRLLWLLTVAGAFVGVESVAGRTGAEKAAIQVGTVVLTGSRYVTLVYICRTGRNRSDGLIMTGQTCNYCFCSEIMETHVQLGLWYLVRKFKVRSFMVRNSLFFITIPTLEPIRLICIRTRMNQFHAFQTSIERQKNVS